MAKRADFTDEEWDMLHKGATGAGLLVSLADRDFTDSFGEASALAKELAAHKGASSELVRELAGRHGTGFGFSASPDKVEAETLAALQAAQAALHAKAPDELTAYRELVLAVARKVAEAKGGVAETESAALAKIEAAVGQG